jgi:hypothetical protein
MGKFLYRSINTLPSGKLWIRYTTNPKDAEKLGGILTCRLVSNINPISRIRIGFKGRTKANFPPI